MIQLGKPFTPSTIINSEEIKMTEVTISCGGGMGGSRWEVYTKDKINLLDKFITIDTNKDKNTIINTNFIVQTRPVKIFRLRVRNDGNKMINHSVGKIKDYYYLVPTNETITLSDKYIDIDSLNIKVIKFNK